MPPTILYLAADLLWASKIKGTADALSIPTRPVRTLEMLEARLADTDVKALLLDLDKPEEALAMIARLRGGGGGPSPTDKEKSIRLIAWGPHVAKDLLQQAKAAGADEVLTRGAMDHTMQEILVGLHARG